MRVIEVQKLKNGSNDTQTDLVKKQQLNLRKNITEFHKNPDAWSTHERYIMQNMKHERRGQVT